MKTYTIEGYQYNTDKKIKIRVLVGSIDQVRDLLTPCTRFLEEERAHNKKAVETRARIRAKKEDLSIYPLTPCLKLSISTAPRAEM